MEISKKQMQLMKHTISDPSRNWFATDEGCADSTEFTALIAGGLATCEVAPAWMGDEIIYRLTERGIFVANEG